MAKKILLKDLANSLNVSTALVSIVLNGKAKEHRIGAAIAQRVIAAAKEMNYSPNLVARNLRGGTTQLIGLIVTDISNPFFAILSRIIENRAIELNYTVVFGSSDENPDNTNKLVQVLLNKGVDGLIIVPCDGSETTIRELHESNKPLVLVDRCFYNLDVSFSCLNNYKATELATQHLIDQGYRNISLLAYKSEMSNVIERISGYEDSMKKAGLSEFVYTKRVNKFNPKFEAYNALDDIIKKKAEAILFSNNVLTINGLYRLNEIGLKVPDDIAVVGFDESDVFDLFYSPITYIKQPIEQFATEAVNILVDKIINGEQSKNSKVVLRPELIIQKSSLKPLK